jgi:AraC-like DNA-binding protein
VLHCVYLGKDMGLGVLFALLDVAVTLYVVLNLLRQRTFSHEERALVTQIESERTQVVGDRSDPASKYAKSRMDEATRTRVRRKLEQAMSQGQLYKDNRLTLRALCDQTRENPHYVSQILNQEFGQNFYEFVNHHRIQHAKAALLADPTKTILEIALDSGFNSKSTFNAAFRDHVGCTPTTFRGAGAAIPSDLNSGLLE